MKRKNRVFYNKECIVFPFAIVYNRCCYEFYPPKKRFELHFLWWHWRWYSPAVVDVFEDDLK